MPGERLPTEFRGREGAGECISDDLLFRYLDGVATPEETRAVQKHLVECRACFEVVAAVAKDSLHAPHEAEWVEFERTVKPNPEKQIAGIMSRVNELFPASSRRVSEGTEEPVETKPGMSPARSIWKRLWLWFEAPILAPRYAWAWAALLVVIAVSLWGIRYYQKTYPLVQVEGELRANYRTYVNLRDYTASAPRLSGGYDHQSIMPMRGEEEGASYLENARRRLEAALVKDSKSVKAKHLLAQIFIMQEAYTQADSILREIPPASLQEAGLMNDQGVLYLAMGNLPAAAENFAAALQADPKLVEARYNLALTKARMGLATEARALLEEYIKLEKNAGWRHAAESILEQLQEKSQ
ncbi:tetratricopeptide repeat protein [candidate division KSB1 bacterium]|nr:tetratricopeptide repeat protein [candidate division KSB1 bacterium]